MELFVIEFLSDGSSFMIEDYFFFGEVLVVEEEMNLSELSEFIENGLFMLSLNEFVFNELFCVDRDL